MDYKEAINWLFGQLPMFSRVGAAAYKPGLDRSFSLARYFDNPHNKFKSIHIGGTNGKGSVSNLLAAILQSQGYKVGLYTSPHLVDFRERIRINGEMISEKEVIDFVEKWKQGEYEGERPSFFELTMIMAFEWFANKKVDYAIIEVGMGGRLDSTNIITPILSIITNISKDHTQFLGETLEKIAFEKAGIIKNKIPVVLGEALPETESVFENKALETKSRLIKAYQNNNNYNKYASYCTLKGDYQINNIKTVLASVEALQEIGICIDEKSISTGLENVEKITGLRGRWSVMADQPLTICDTGHNEAGLRYNISQLERLKSEQKNCKIRFVIGFVADKDIENIIRLFPQDAIYYLTQAQIPRALPYQELTDKFKEIKSSVKHVKSFASVKEAYEIAKKEAAPNDIIYIGGSTFIVADFLASM